MIARNSIAIAKSKKGIIAATILASVPFVLAGFFIYLVVCRPSTNLFIKIICCSITAISCSTMLLCLFLCSCCLEKREDVDSVVRFGMISFISSSASFVVTMCVFADDSELPLAPLVAGIISFFMLGLIPIGGLLDLRSERMIANSLNSGAVMLMVSTVSETTHHQHLAESYSQQDLSSLMIVIQIEGRLSLLLVPLVSPLLTKSYIQIYHLTFYSC